MTKPPKQLCARIDEHWSTTADCCGSSNNQCINNFCAFVDLR